MWISNKRATILQRRCGESTNEQQFYNDVKNEQKSMLYNNFTTVAHHALLVKQM